MLRKTRFGALLALVALVATAAFATTAMATPDESSPCDNCHGGSGATVTTTLVSTVGGIATYSVTAPGSDAIALFNGATKLGMVETGQIAVPVGSTYTLYAVTGPDTSGGLGTASVSPVDVVTPPADVTAPVTTSDAAATYVSVAAINLTATDAGSGVATTYYKVDGGAQTAGKAIAVSTLGAHTISFWSVDVAGNIESAKTASFTITAVTPPVDATAPVTTSDALASYVASAAIKLSATDGGSGVANTFYKLDAGVQTTGTAIAVSTVGTHTVSFWSVDKAGNIESAKTATFTVTPAVVIPPVESGTTTTTISIHASHGQGHWSHWGRNRGHRSMTIITLFGKLTPGAKHQPVSLYVMAPGSTTWTLVKVLKTDGSHKSKSSAWDYRLAAKTKGLYQFQVRFAGTDTLSASVSKIITVKVH